MTLSGAGGAARLGTPTIAPTAARACPRPHSGPAGVDSRLDSGSRAHPGALTPRYTKKGPEGPEVGVEGLFGDRESEYQLKAGIASSIAFIFGAFQEGIPFDGVLL